MAISQEVLETSHGTIALRLTQGGSTPVLMIHGNSLCGSVFQSQMNGRLGERYRLMAPDLPGHGDSGDAFDPERSYCVEGYADAMTEVLRLLGVGRVVVFGWSLGGHVGIEMIERFPGLCGLMITGTPPISPAQIAQGYKPSLYGAKEVFSDEDADAFVRWLCGLPDAELCKAAARTDGRARRLVFEKFAAGTGRDQSVLVATAMVPIAVVNGSKDPAVDTDFVARARYGNLWEGEIHWIENSGHAPFLDAPDRFDPIFSRFLDSVGSA